MDFPIDLKSKPTYVRGRKEVEQAVILLLRNHVGSFIQDFNLGAKFGIHETSLDRLEEGIRMTLKQIELISVNDINVIGGDVYIRISYRGEIITFQHTLEV